MSFRGFQKSVARVPQQFRSKFNIGETTKDAIYLDADRRFQEVESETKKLHSESKKYFDAINSMLSHQIDFSKAMTEIYKPISGRMSDPDAITIQGNPEGIRACEEYEAVVQDLQETLAPELEMIDTRVIRPADELLDVIKAIRKTAMKRDHKQLDYDRHRSTLKKLQDKKEKSPKDEKATWKAENDVENATQEFNYFNDLLKDELPKLFALEREFIQPLFQSFYYMQLNIFYTLHEKMQHMDIGYFDLTLDIEEAFHKKRGDIQGQCEALTIIRFRSTGMKRPAKYGSAAQPAIEGPKTAGRLLTAGPPAAAASTLSGPRIAYNQQTDVVENPPPPYSPASTLAPAPTALALAPAPVPAPVPASPAVSSSLVAAAAAAKSKPPPPPKPKPSRLSSVPTVETVTALYDYSAQAEGDLSFRVNDVIEVIHRTANDNEWWTGRLQGRQGQFPGNYVKLNR